MTTFYDNFLTIFSCPEQLNRWPCHSLTDWLRVLLLLTLQSDPRDLRPLRYLIRVMKRHDLTLKDLPTYLPVNLHMRTTLRSNPIDLWPLKHLIRVMRRHYLKTIRQIWRPRHWEISLKEQPKGLVNIETHITFLAPKHSLSFFKKERYMGQYLCIFCSHFIISFFWLVTAWSWRIQ